MSAPALTLAACVLLAACVAILAYLAYRAQAPTARGVPPYAYGLDFSWSRPSIAAMLAAGYSFVCRYHSWDETSGKNLSADEAAAYRAAGMDVVSNWEYAPEAPLGGYWQGYDDAVEGLRQHEADGGGPDDPIYFSVDWDVDMLYEYPVVADYFVGVAAVLPLRRIGAYGGYAVICALFDDGLITYGWQTYAWSYGWWDARAQLRQVQNGIYVGGQVADRNEAWAVDFGAWGQAAPLSEGDSAVLLNCPDEPERLDLLYVGAGGAVWHRWYPAGGMNALWTGAGQVECLGGRIVVGTLTAQWAPDASCINVAGLGEPDIDGQPPPGCGQYWGYVIGRGGIKSGWGSIPDVYGAYPSGAPTGGG